MTQQLKPLSLNKSIVLEKDISQHLLDHHAEQVMEHLFDEEEYYKVKQDLIDEKNNKSGA